MYPEPFQSPKDNNTQTQADSRSFQYPRAYNTQTRANTGQFQQSPYGYYGYPDAPPPPPPQVNKFKRYRILINILVALGLVFGGGIVGAMVSRQFSQTYGQTQTGTYPTPTQDVAIGLEAPDFPTFLKVFATALASKDYTDIQKATDTLNFQYIPLNADGVGNWKSTYDELTTGNLSAVVQYPPITAAQEDYCNFASSDFPGMVETDVGTLSGNSVDGTTQANRDGTIFVFESATGSIWIWRAMIASNTPC